MKTGSHVRVAGGLRGQGVFAQKTYRRDHAVGRILGEMIRDPDYTSAYCIDVGDGYTLEPAAPFRFLNHSCRPNCEIVSREGNKGEPPTAWVYAIRKIHVEDELTIDYAWPASDSIRCACGSADCRGWIVHKSELTAIRSVGG